MFVTTITQEEILHGVLLLPQGRRRNAIEAAAGAMFDAQIAAVAKSAGVDVVIRNVPDFEGCGIKVISPWE